MRRPPPSFSVTVDARTTDYVVSEREMQARIANLLTIADAPSGDWKVSIIRRVKCRSDSFWATSSGEFIMSQRGSYNLTLRMDGGSEYRYECALSFHSGAMPSGFSQDRLVHASAVYSALVNDMAIARRRTALAALPTVLNSEELDAPSSAKLLAELDLSPDLPVAMLVRALAVFGGLLPYGEGYVAVEPNRDRLRLALSRVPLDKHDHLHAFLEAVENKEREISDAGPFLDLPQEEVAVSWPDLQELYGLVSGLMLGFDDGSVTVHRAMARLLRKLFDKMRQAASPKPDNGATGRESLPPQGKLEVARARYEALTEEHVRTSTSLSTLQGRRQSAEAELIVRRRAIIDLEGQLSAARVAEEEQTQELAHQDDQILVARQEEQAAMGAALEAQDDVLVLEEEDRVARALEAQAQREKLLKLLAANSFSAEQALALLEGSVPTE